MNQSNQAQLSPLLERAMHCHEQGQLAEAHELYKRVLVLEPRHDVALNYIGLLEMQRGRPLEAVEYVQGAVDCAPGNRDYRFNLARALLAVGRVDEAVASAESAVVTGTATADDHLRLAELYDQLGRNEETVAAVRRSLDLRPAFPRALKRLGDVLGKMAQHGEAAAAYRQALDFDPDFAEAANELGNALQSNGEAEAALAAYRLAAELSPDRAQVHANIGHVHQRAGRLEDAVTAYDKALECDLRFVGARYLRATTKLTLNETQAALRDVELSLQHEPHHQESIALKAILLRELGREDEASQLVDLQRFVSVRQVDAPPGYGSIRQFNRELERYVIGSEPLRRDPVGASTRGGRHSEDILVRPSGPVVVLKQMLQRVFGDYLQSLPVDPSHPFLSRAPNGLRLVAQANILDSAGFLVPHIHPYAWVSGAYYVRVPREVSDNDPLQAGWLEIGRPPSELSATATPEVRRVCPAEGTVVLFPSYAYHGTLAFKAARHRFSLGIDVLTEH